MGKRGKKELSKYIKKGVVAEIGFSTSGDVPLLLECLKKAKLKVVTK